VHLVSWQAQCSRTWKHGSTSQVVTRSAWDFDTQTSPEQPTAMQSASLAHSPAASLPSTRFRQLSYKAPGSIGTAAAGGIGGGADGGAADGSPQATNAKAVHMIDD
jgi:hypothetical protein